MENDDWKKYYKNKKGALNRKAAERDHYKLIDGKWYHEENPQGYWDWYTLNGREPTADLKAKTKPEEDEDEETEYIFYHKISDYDFKTEFSPKQEVRARKDWRKFSKNGDGWYSEEYYLQRYGDEDTYVKVSAIMQNAPWAFITPDGVWHHPGEVSWFALDDATKEGYMKYCEEWKHLLETGKDYYVSFVDCHI